jgi:WASH complex subunit strumpellin
LTGLGGSFSQSSLFSLLLNTAQFEFRLRSMYKRLLKNRADNFEKYRTEARSRMTKLSAIYATSGEGSGRKTNKLRDWFLARDEQMSHLSLDGRKLFRTAR